MHFSPHSCASQQNLAQLKWNYVLIENSMYIGAKTGGKTRGAITLAFWIKFSKRINDCQTSLGSPLSVKAP